MYGLTALSLFGFLLYYGLCEAAILGNDFYKPLPTLGPLTACPPATPIQICEATCSTDYNCPNRYKCCPTQCGGSVCTLPVTATRYRPTKMGSCPLSKTGPWICSDMCSNDADCVGNFKCCPNRCGALVCSRPEQ